VVDAALLLLGEVDGCRIAICSPYKRSMLRSMDYHATCCGGTSTFMTGRDEAAFFHEEKNDIHNLHPTLTI